MAWKPGVSGNPGGRPVGSRHKVTILAEQLLHGQAEALVNKVVEQALEGDSQCLRVCIERLLPVCKELPLNLAIPKAETAEQLPGMIASIVEHVMLGKILPSEGKELCGLVDSHRRSLELNDLETRLAALEAKIGGKQR
jgi:hypothetical protein